MDETVVTYTTAEVAYDWFGTEDDGPVGTASNGKTVRRVRSPKGREQAQRGRYMSGNHMCADEAEWRKLVDYGLVRDVRLDAVAR
jgi:hypothetical protein